MPNIPNMIFELQTFMSVPLYLALPKASDLSKWVRKLLKWPSDGHFFRSYHIVLIQILSHKLICNSYVCNQHRRINVHKLNNLDVPKDIVWHTEMITERLLNSYVKNVQTEN